MSTMCPAIEPFPSRLTAMSITAFVDEFPVVQKILESMDLWKIPERPPPKPLPRDLYEYDEYECAS
ncbi:MAG: hypothetical protein AB2L14_35025 [Candidatus Xenobiia bacterium LiM19]